jgi:2-polyprenyl-3-methyl-5-hydroxy-6-metoxy-1,4-benzoquinol methylase
MHRDDYDNGWTQWSDMIKYSPAPFHRRRLIIRLAKTYAFESILDAGCGNGELLQSVGMIRAGVRRVGIDLSDGVVGTNRAAFPSCEFHAIDIEKTSLRESFDLVVCSEVLEHIENYHSALRHLRKMCSGHLILTVPMGKVFKIDRMMGHCRHFTAPEIVRALEQNGFQAETVWRWGFPFHTMYKRVINAFPDAAMRRFAGKTYSRSDRLIGRLTAWLFYLNARDCGISNQLIVGARICENNHLTEEEAMSEKGVD